VGWLPDLAQELMVVIWEVASATQGLNIDQIEGKKLVGKATLDLNKVMPEHTKKDD
jgi:hypothetical protein